MKRAIVAACAALAIVSVNVSAQTPQNPHPREPATGAPSPGETTMTLTGCLKPWSASTTARLATPPNPEAGQPSTEPAGDAQYVLTDINDSATRKAGGMAHDMYILKAKDATVNVSQHLNHKVQVTGMVTSDSSSRGVSTPPATVTTPPPDSPATPRDTIAAAGKPATLTVSSITMISTTCPTTF